MAPRRRRLQRLDEHDQWPLRIAIGGLVLLGLLSVTAIILLSNGDRNLQGLFAIPASVITALASFLMQRPPWSARGTRADPDDRRYRGER